MAKISYIFFFLFLACAGGYAEQGKVKIVFCDDYYCTQMPTGEEFKIVKQVDWAANKVTLSPDEKYVVYTTSNGLGFENEGRDVFYCKVDGDEKTFLHKFEFSVDTLIWASSDERDFIFVISWDCFPGHGGVQVIDLSSKTLILTFSGNSLQKIQNTDCYQVYCLDKPVQQDRQKICLGELEAIKEPDSTNLRFYAGWTMGDIYVSTQRDPLVKFGDPRNPAKEQEVVLRSFLWGGYPRSSELVPNGENNHMAFSGKHGEYGFLGVFDLENRRLILFDYSDSLKFSNTIWSLDGRRLAVLRTNNWDRYFDFYEIDDKGEMNLIKTYRVETDRPISNFRWSDDSKKFYYSYLFSNYQKVQVEVDLEDK